LQACTPSSSGQKLERKKTKTLHNFSGNLRVGLKEVAFERRKGVLETVKRKSIVPVLTVQDSLRKQQAMQFNYQTVRVNVVMAVDLGLFQNV
jgi:hypothetical protein